MQSTRLLSKVVIRQWRRFSIRSTLKQTPHAGIAIQNVTIPPPSNIDQPVPPKIEKLINEIANLSLIEVTQLTGGLKKRLNIPDAPILPAGFGAGSVALPKEQEEEVETAKVKSSYTVKLMKFEEKQKVALIKEIKSLIEGMNLVQAKKFVESAPAVVKADVNKEEAEKLKEALSKVGATIEVD